MRGLTAMLWESSVLDANEGMYVFVTPSLLSLTLSADPTPLRCSRFHGLSLPELLPKLPEPQPESMFWYLLTGQIPSEQDAKAFSKDLLSRSDLGADVERVIDSYVPVSS